jgi:hypothetical protein
MDIFEDYETWYLDNTYGYQAPPKKEAMPMETMPKEEPYVAKSRASMASELEAKGIIATPSQAAQSVLVDAPVAMVKGAAQGFLGLAGDLEMLLQGVYSMATNDEAKPKLQKFLDGLEKDTVLPTTEKIKQFIDDNSNYFKGLRNLPQQTGGELLAPGGYVKAIKSLKPMAKVASPIAVGTTGLINEKAK